MSSGRNDINDAGPRSLDELVGQKAVVAQVRVALDAARADGKTFDQSALVGPPGLGKTQVARLIAAEMGRDFVEVLGQAIACPADLNAVLLGASEGSVVFIDEAHELEKEYQTSLYLAIDQHRVCINGGRAGRPPQSIALKNFSLLLATTDEFGLLQPLRDRMRMILRFEFLGLDDLVEVVRRRSVALDWPVEADVLPRIARRSRGTPRLALRLLQACRRVCRADGASAITTGHFEKACLLEGIDGLGLGPADQHYLRVVAEGACRLNVIASRLGLPARTVAEVCEPFLIRAGLLEKDDQGRRQITAIGREHLSQAEART